jgi:hypothetical protein
MFIINPDPYSLPSYRIGPFRTADLSKNHSLPDNNDIDIYFRERFGDRDYIYTENGRMAINYALSSLNLKKNDVVTILTTSNNYYISSCVTKEIEKFCKWSRNIAVNTKVIFVNHEFGYPYDNLLKIKNFDLPIIEDCAGSFFSQDRKNLIGNIGDYIIYSFPKMFPLQIGGLLVSNFPGRLRNNNLLKDERLRYIKNVLSFYLNSKEEIIHKRITNYRFLKCKFETLGFKERFQLDPGIVPGVFMFKTNKLKVDLPELKKYFYIHGVQCSVFYGEESFFIPVHQALNEHDMLYFYKVIESFIHKVKL